MLYPTKQNTFHYSTWRQKIKDMLSRIISYLSKIRSYVFCFKHLPYSQARLCPILLHWRTKIYVAKGASIRIDNPQKYGIRIGIWGGSYNLAYRRTIFQIFDKGKVLFDDTASFCKGTHVIVRGNGRLTIGHKFFCNANCNILCNKFITFGLDNLLGWNITILDSDGHDTYVCNVRQDSQKGITSGNHVWIGANSTILKGVCLADNTIVPYGSVIHKSNKEENVVFQNKVLKTDIHWKD